MTCHGDSAASWLYSHTRTTNESNDSIQSNDFIAPKIFGYPIQHQSRCQLPGVRTLYLVWYTVPYKPDHSNRTTYNTSRSFECFVAGTLAFKYCCIVAFYPTILVTVRGRILYKEFYRGKILYIEFYRGKILYIELLLVDLLNASF